MAEDYQDLALKFSAWSNVEASGDAPSARYVREVKYAWLPVSNIGRGRASFYNIYVCWFIL